MQQHQLEPHKGVLESQTLLDPEARFLEGFRVTQDAVLRVFLSDEAIARLKRFDVDVGQGLQ